MHPCPRCQSHSIQLFVIDEYVRILECTAEGCYSRFVVNLSIIDQERSDRLHKIPARTAGKNKAGRKPLKLLPCPVCGKDKTRIVRNYEDPSGTTRKVQCISCFTIYKVWSRFVEYIDNGPGYMKIKNPGTFISLFSKNTKQELLQALIKEIA